MLDLAILNGRIVDGSGAPPRVADIGIRDGQIQSVGEALADAPAARRIDATGKTVTPGFIDAHGHSDVGLFVNPRCESKLAQGITTEVIGNCGYSPFPRLENNRGYLLDPAGVDLPWSSAPEYFDHVGRRGMGINAVPQVGHITIRAAVLDNQDRPATPAEIQSMRGHVRDAMAAGARGLSTGLDYHCSTVADLDEIVDLAEIVAEFGGFYSSHLRGYSRNVINAVVEAIEVGRRTGIPVQISHLGAFGRRQWGYAPRLTDVMAAARADGVRVACDMMAYRTKGSWWAPRAIFPADLYAWKRPWAENLPALRAALRDPAERARIREVVEARRARPKFGFHEEFVQFSDWRDIYIEELPQGSPHARFRGMSVAAIAEQLDRDPCDLYFDLIVEEGDGLGSTCIQVAEADFLHLLQDSWTMFGTDAIATHFDRLREPWNSIQPHPRHYGTFPRLLASFIRDEGRLDLAAGIRRMTGLVADHFGLDGRGYLRPGGHADLVVLDMDTIGEGATWRLPNAYPTGIETVLVNGVSAVEAGAPTGALAGTMLKRPN